MVGRSSPRLPPALHRDFPGTGEHEQPHPCLTAPVAVPGSPWQEEHGPDAVGRKKGIQGLLYFPPEPNSDFSPAQCALQSLTNKGLINAHGFRGFSTIFFFFQLSSLTTELMH